MTVKHLTASTLLWHASAGEWRIGLVEHPLRPLLLPPGGHVEQDENTEETALRELTEETGITADLVEPAGTAVHASFPVPLVGRPWWICEHQIPRDSKLDGPHVHVDHVYVAIAGSAEPEKVGELPFSWYPRSTWPDIAMPEDVRQLAEVVLPLLTDFTTAY